MVLAEGKFLGCLPRVRGFDPLQDRAADFVPLLRYINLNKDTRYAKKRVYDTLHLQDYL